MIYFLGLSHTQYPALAPPHYPPLREWSTEPPRRTSSVSAKKAILKRFGLISPDGWTAKKLFSPNLSHSSCSRSKLNVRWRRRFQCPCDIECYYQGVREFFVSSIITPPAWRSKSCVLRRRLGRQWTRMYQFRIFQYFATSRCCLMYTAIPYHILRSHLEVLNVPGFPKKYIDAQIAPCARWHSIYSVQSCLFVLRRLSSVFATGYIWISAYSSRYFG